MKTFQEFVAERERLAEAKESDQLRKVLIGNMGLEEVIADKGGEQIPLLQLKPEVIGEKLKSSALWKNIPVKARKAAEIMLMQPGNKLLADLLDVFKDVSLDIGTVEDDEPSPQKTPEPTPAV